MIYWKDLLRGDPLPWLLEKDIAQPGVRFFALRDIMGQPEGDAEVTWAKREIMASGPVPAILAAQEPQGYWVKPGPGYGPKYQGSVWQVIFLGQFGADGSDNRVKKSCDYVLKHSGTGSGGLSVNGTGNGFIHCMAGNLGRSLVDLSCLGDVRLVKALEYQARAVTGEGIASAEEKNAPERYYKSGTSGPMFRCAANMGEPCAWGAVKAILAFASIPDARRTPVIREAIRQGSSFLLSADPATADYPHPWAPKPSRSWFQFGYPIGYVTDVLQVLEAMAAVGMSRDERLINALQLVLDKQDERGRWKMEYTYNGKTWADIEKKGKPSKWVTLRALRVLKSAYSQ